MGKKHDIKRLNPGDRKKDGMAGRPGGKPCCTHTKGATTANAAHPEQDLETQNRPLHLGKERSPHGEGESGRALVSQDPSPSPSQPTSRRKRNTVRRERCSGALLAWPWRSALGRQVHSALSFGDEWDWPPGRAELQHSERPRRQLLVEVRLHSLSLLRPNTEAAV